MQSKDLENYIEFLLSAALQRCGNIYDAEDLTQETLLAALSYMAYGKDIQDVKAWLLVVMGRKFNDMLRKRYKQPIVSIGDDFDIVDENGKPTGETVERKTAHSEGIRHRTAHVWIVRKSDEGAEVLLQKRAMNKDSFPGRYDTSSAGHIQAGDEPEESAIRELHEELGIKASVDDLQFVDTFVIQYEKEFYGKMFKDSEIAFVYVYTKPVNIDELTLQKEELDGVEWFNLEYVYEECRKHNQKFCAPVGGLEIVRRFVRGTGL